MGIRRGRFGVCIKPSEVTRENFAPIREAFSDIELIGADENKGYVFLEANSPVFTEIEPGDAVPWYGTDTYRYLDTVRVKIHANPYVSDEACEAVMREVRETIWSDHRYAISGRGEAKTATIRHLIKEGRLYQYRFNGIYCVEPSIRG